MTIGPLVDFHCHLDLFPDFAAAVAECERERVFTLTVTTTPRAWPRNEELVRETKYVRAALGLHPQLVHERASEISIFDEYLPKARYVGEVGLDAGPRFYSSFTQQREIFERILRSCAKAGGKILTIHSVRAVRPVLDMIEANLPSARGKAVLHWFTGTHADARRAVDLGCYFSINAKMLDSERHTAMVASLPSDRLLTETDGPFVMIGDKATRPVDVQATVQRLAQALATEAPILSETIAQNLRRLVSG